MELFIKYQVPSYLQSFSDIDDASESGERLSAVKRHVADMLAMVREAKEAEIAERQQERDRDNDDRVNMGSDLSLQFKVSNCPHQKYVYGNRFTKALLIYFDKINKIRDVICRVFITKAKYNLLLPFNKATKER